MCVCVFPYVVATATVKDPLMHDFGNIIFCVYYIDLKKMCRKVDEKQDI